MLGYLAERGLPGADLDRVHVPAGLDLGRTSHEEMAVAILAQLVQLRAAGEAGAAGPVAAAAVAPEMRAPLPTAASPSGAEAVDPVCGMVVAADAGQWPLEHDGVTYYFCSAGCQRSFTAGETTPQSTPTPPLSSPRRAG